jgi:putative multiple sugar transport system substrate-binding protein
MKKLLSVLLVTVLASGFAFAGGGQQSGGGAAAPAASSGGKTLIGIAMPENHVLRWVKDGASLKKFAEEAGYAAQDAYGNADQNLQNQQMESMITNGAKLIVAAVVNDGANGVIKEAADEGIKIIAYDRIIENSPDVGYFITFNNDGVGARQAQGLIEGMGLDQATTANPKTITLFAGSITDKNAFWFFNGAKKVLNPYIEKGVLKVVGPHPHLAYLADGTTPDPAFQAICTENWQAPIAKARMENLLGGDARNVTLDGVLAPNDTLARAIIEALKADAKYANKLPIVTGQDAEADSLVAIINGEQYMTVFKDTTVLARSAIMMGDQILKGQPINIPNSQKAVGELEFMSDNGAKKLDTTVLTPALITKNNFMDVIKAGFYNAEEEAKILAAAKAKGLPTN